MKRMFLAFSFLGLMLVAALIVGAGLGAARADQPSVELRPTATPAPLPSDYEPSAPAAPDSLPDLVVTEIRLSAPEPYVNQPVTVFVTIKNIGDADVEPGNNFFLDFYINPPTDDLRGMPGDHDWDVQGYQMKAGQSAVFSFTLEEGFPDTVSYNLWAQVDTPVLLPPPNYFPNGFVSESDEDNNIFGPQYVTIRTHYAWVQKDHEDYFRNMASTLDVVPVVGTVGIITNTPGLVIEGDSALALGIFDEPPQVSWGISPTIPPAEMFDYNMIYPDTQLNEVVTNYQRYPFIHAEGDLVVAVWEDGRNGPTYGKDVFLRWSDDKGETWNPPTGGLQVNETSGGHDRNDQKHPVVAVAPNGNIVVAWQDHRDESFDIYVQAFSYTGTTLRACDSHGDCSSACDLSTEECNFRVDTDANDEDQILPDITVDHANNFFIAWQDQRNGNDDIFAVRSYTSMVSCPTNRDVLGFAPHPVVEGSAAPNQVYLCWGDDTRIHDDPSATKQASPAISAVHGLKIIDIKYEIVPYPPPFPPELVVTDVISEPTTYVVVTWEDWREGDADIYFTYSDDVGETFVIDARLNDDKPANSTNGIEQRAPAVAVNQWMKQVTLVKHTEYGDADGEVVLPVTTMHIVWQDFRHSTNPAKDNDPDIYYNSITIEPDTEFPWSPIFSIGEQQQVNGNDWRAWQTDPVWQGEPEVAATSSGLTLEDSEGYNAYVVWADGRNYGAGDFDNLDIYFRLFSNVGEPTAFVGGNNIMLNDGARLHDFDVNTYEGYRQDMPPHARQRYPSIASTLVADWPTIFPGGYVFVAWDDDRLLDPFTDRNIYLARSNLLFGGHYRTYAAPPLAPPDAPGQGERYGSGSFVSEIFDSYSKWTAWYIVDWHAVTDSGTYITLQTRMGNTREDVLNSDWYPKRFPYPDDAVSKGSPLQGYDAPGQHIEDAAGNTCPDNCPRARFIQYRVNFWARDASVTPGATELHTPFLFDVILHYEQFINYLPLVYMPLP